MRGRWTDSYAPSTLQLRGLNLLEKITVTRLDKKFPDFNGNKVHHQSQKYINFPYHNLLESRKAIHFIFNIHFNINFSSSSRPQKLRFNLKILKLNFLYACLVSVCMLHFIITVYQWSREEVEDIENNLPIRLFEIKTEFLKYMWRYDCGSDQSENLLQNNKRLLKSTCYILNVLQDTDL